MTNQLYNGKYTREEVDDMLRIFGHTSTDLAGVASEQVKAIMNDTRMPIALGIPGVEKQYVPRTGNTFLLHLAYTHNGKTLTLNHIRRSIVQQINDAYGPDEDRYVVSFDFENTIGMLALSHIRSRNPNLLSEAQLLTLKASLQKGGYEASEMTKRLLDLYGNDVSQNLVDVLVDQYGPMAPLVGDKTITFAPLGKDVAAWDRLTPSMMVAMVERTIEGGLLGRPIKVEAVIVDYLTAIRPDRPDIGETDYRLKINSVAESLFMASRQFNCLLATAIQANTQSLSNPLGLPGAANCFESSMPVKRADVVISAAMPKTQGHLVGTMLKYDHPKGKMEIEVTEGLQVVSLIKQRGDGMSSGGRWWIDWNAGGRSVPREVEGRPVQDF